MPHQTGATSPQGKAAICLNGLTHGGTSHKLFVPGENPDDFHQLLETYFAEVQPATLINAGLVTDLALARWYLWRRQRACAASEECIFQEKTAESDLSAEDLHRLDLLDRYKTEGERALHRALRNVQNIKKEETREEHWRAQFALQKQRFELEAQQFKMSQERQANQAEAKQQTAPEASFNEMLQKFKEYQQSAPPPPPGDEIRPERYEDLKVIVQTVTVTNTGGPVSTEFYPSNAGIRHYLSYSEPSTQPVSHILRFFIFDGKIPDDYQWFSRADVPEDGVLISDYIWISLAEAENKLPVPRALNHLDPLWEAMAA